MITKNSILKAIGDEYRQVNGTTNANEVKQFSSSFDEEADFMAQVLGPLSNDIVSAKSIMNYWIKMAELILSKPEYTKDFNPDEIAEFNSALQQLKNGLQDPKKFLRDVYELSGPDAEFIYVFEGSPQDLDISEDVVKSFNSHTLTMEMLVHRYPSVLLQEDPYEEVPQS